MNCFICGSKIETTGFLTEHYNGTDFYYHAWCDPNIAYARAYNIVAKPLNIKHYTTQSAQSGVYKVIEDNIVGEL